MAGQGYIWLCLPCYHFANFRLCAAGQGYIWLAHRDPASPGWPLARRSKAMWQQQAAAAGSSKLGEAMEWQVGH
jgi:hypothetical protein